MKALHYTAFILLIIGGLNWLLVAFGFNFVDWLLGGFAGGVLAQLVYILVGLSAVFEAVTHKKHCTECRTMPSAGSSM